MAGIAAGIVAFVWPAITALVLLYLIAAWLVATGLLEVGAAVLLRRELRGEWLLVLAGVLSVVFGCDNSGAASTGPPEPDRFRVEPSGGRHPGRRGEGR